MFFFIGAATKIAVIVSWRTTSVSLCSSNDLQLEIQKRCSFLKNIALLWICAFGLQAVPRPSYYLTSIVDKLTMVQLLLLFLCTFCSFLATPEVS